MLRITLSTHRSPHLILEGRLIGPWVAELRAAVSTARSAAGSVKLDLSGIHFVDNEGLMLLRRLAEEGVALSNASPFIQELLIPSPNRP